MTVFDILARRNADKLRAMTGWAPAYTFEQCLAETNEWIRGHMDAFRTGVYSL